MTAADPAPREPLIIAPDQGRHYAMGRMTAVFMADGAHAHSDEHVFYVIEGTVAVEVAGHRTQASRGAYIVIPGGTPHDLENRGTVRAGFISINVPGGFEEMMPRLLQHFAANPVGDVVP
jgi:mannose-6-phosphate isomerase-like protein (cupin superfamily)